MKRFLTYSLFVLASLTATWAQESYSGSIVADEGAWCWFADPRALHYENAAGTINATYFGYIDVHGNVKATQYDWVSHRKTEVLIRSYFQPDDHNNPTFIVLPDERVMIFYTRHTDEAKIWYRISRKPGDITALGEEKFLTTANNTTYPSPFILSDDPTHIYLCWRGINWHPTIARLTMPDENDNCAFDFGPKQIVQSTGARPYAKYQSNGKNKIYVSYTTGHPDNEMPDWLYLNVIDINGGNPILRDVKGKKLSIIKNGVFNVDKSDSYASSYPYTIVDKTANVRNWVWQVALDANGKPVIAYPHIDTNKTSHEYWYARWTGSAWKTTRVCEGGHAFHQNWNQTERCYSGGMALDPDNVGDLYLSIPTKNGTYNKDGVYEIWKYTIDDKGSIVGSQQITVNSTKNNSRPFVIPGSKDSEMRLTWMNGDYYYWMVNKNYPKGYPTDIRCNYEWQEKHPRTDSLCLAKNKTLNLTLTMNQDSYGGQLFSIGNMTYSLDADNYPVITIDGNAYRSQNRLLTSDNWATGSSGTNRDNHPTKLSTWILSLTYDGKVLTTHRNGLVDQVIDIGPLTTTSMRTFLVREDVLDIINTVNKTWQQRNPNHGNYFWNRAVYHIGNMEAYAATGIQQYRDFSAAWATKNNWWGATGINKANWKYANYGEGADHVLFGDNQVCFQTYIDLYNLDEVKDETKIARALEVMDYEISASNNDYIWWVDGLFMVMPIMTKLYHITGNQAYLDKMYAYWQYANSIMYDDETGLYFRDAKYVYPAHTTNSGKKDFWARGDGWIFACFAKVLNELPVTDSHRDEYISYYRRLAAALKKCQQKEGYWTRSLLDPAQAPGYETSGTALYTYGFAWGVRNGILDEVEYGQTIERAWNYLTSVALQSDGTVGYIQPIGENASPNTTVKPTDYHDFGVGAFLLAASEMSRLAATIDSKITIKSRNFAK